MKRLEKVNAKTANDVNNGNGSEERFRQNIFRKISKSFHIDSVELVDNNEFIYDDLRNNLDDDVFLDKEREFSSTAAGLDNFGYDKSKSRPSFGDDGAKSENTYQGDEKAREDAKKEAGRIGRPRRPSDVIDSIGDDCVNLRRSMESEGIAIVTPRSRASSDLGYSGSFTSTSSAASFSFPPQAYMVGGSGGGKGVNDITDSKPFTHAHGGIGDGVPEARMPVDRDADEYNMNHPRRGRAIIINNDTFDNNLANPRKGSQVDAQNLKEEFYNLGFDVTVIYNPTYHEIQKSISEISQEDHSDADCLMLAVLTHGMDNGWLFARDTLYPVSALWHPFTADNCITLAGKPKIFFVQACRGNKFDPGVILVNRKGSVSETDAATSAYKLPSHSDFLIAYSSTDGFYSWRNTEEGTWFIQSLVQELRTNGTQINFLDILTRVNRRVAVNFSSYNEEFPWLHEQKQVSTFQSTLIRDLIFRPKIRV